MNIFGKQTIKSIILKGSKKNYLHFNAIIFKIISKINNTRQTKSSNSRVNKKLAEIESWSMQSTRMLKEIK